MGSEKILKAKSACRSPLIFNIDLMISSQLLFMKPRYDHTIKWLQYTSNCNFPLWKLRELRVKVVLILKETFDIMSAVDNATNQPRPSQELAYWLALKEQLVAGTLPLKWLALIMFPEERAPFPNIETTFTLSSLSFHRGKLQFEVYCNHLHNWSIISWFPKKWFWWWWWCQGWNKGTYISAFCLFSLLVPTCPGTQIFCMYPTRPVPKSKTPTRRALP